MRWLENRIPPLVILAITAASMWAVASGAGMSGAGMSGAGMSGVGMFAFDLPFRSAPAFVVAIAVALATLGIGIAIAGVVAFSRAHTTVNPVDPSKVSALVDGGVFRLTRNPMYLGMTLVLAGWGVSLGSFAALVVVAGFVGYIDRFQIVPEERALAAIFGDDFTSYCARVRRWA